MSQKVREEMLPRLRQRYLERGRQGRSRMLDEVCEQFGYDRKHAIKLLSGKVVGNTVLAISTPHAMRGCPARRISRRLRASAASRNRLGMK